VTIPIHHSRDSYTKQWLETLEKALRGWAAYLRMMLAHVMHLPCFKQDWATLTSVLQGLIAMDNCPNDSGSRKLCLHLLQVILLLVVVMQSLSIRSARQTARAATAACSCQTAKQA
jgi:hypothetical protein